MADDAAAVLDAAGSRRAGAAPSERALLAGFFLALYTPRAHDDGTVAALIDEVLAFPHEPAPEAASAPWTPSPRTGASTGSGASPSPRWCRPAAST